MTITEKQIKEGGHEYRFDNGCWVCLWPEDAEGGTWEFQSDERDEETYSSGGYLLQDNAVYDYDGCVDLPLEVIMAMNDYGYNIDL